MTKFKRVCLMGKWMLLLIVAAMEVSCVKAQKHEGKAAGNAPRSFRFSRAASPVDVSGYAENQIISQNIQAQRVAFTGVISDQANYGDKREYNLSMCGLSDIRTQNPLIGQKFEIHSELNVKAKGDEGGKIVTVENDSCIYWTVTLPFNPFGDSINLYVNFVFLAKTGSPTYIHRTMLFNPWDQQRGSNPETFDFTRHGLTPAMNAQRWAYGYDEIEQALKGELNKYNTVKKLEIGSVQFVPVKKDARTGEYVEPAKPQDAMETTNVIGDQTNKELERINKVRLSNMAERANRELPLYQSLDLHLNLRLSDLKVRLYDSANINTDMNLSTGRYKIDAQLVATDLEAKGHYIITNAVTYENINQEQPTWKTQTMGVNAVLPLALAARPQWGNINLVLRVTPMDIPSVKPFEAVYNLGTFDTIGQGKSPIFDLSEFRRSKNDELEFSFDNYLSKAKNYKQWKAGNPEEGIDTDSIEKGFRRFRFTHLEVLFSRIVPGDTATDRTIQYTVRTCLTDNFTGARLQGGRHFDIETEDRGVKLKIEHVSDDQGCLSWVGLISHKFYHREQLVPKISKITYLGDAGKKETQELKYYINPWDEKFTFGRDARVLPEYYLEQIAEGQKFAPPTRLLITSFKYDAIGFRYVVDKYMNLTVKKTVLLEMRPKILKYNSIVWGRSGFNDVRDGIYLLKIAMQKDYLDPSAPGREVICEKLPDGGCRYRVKSAPTDNKNTKVYLTIKESLVRVLGGEIVTPIEIDVTDLRTLRLRAQMFIQLETIDETLLRAAMLIDNKLSQKALSSSDLTVEIAGLQNQVSALDAQIAAKTEEAKRIADRLELQKQIEELKFRKNVDLAKIRKLLSGLDAEAVKKVTADLDVLRKSGQTAQSIQGNVKYNAINDVLEKIVKQYKSQSREKKSEIQESYAAQKLKECARHRKNLMAQGDTATAELFNPDVANTLCKTDIPEDQMYYFLTSRLDIGSERWLKEILTPEEFQTYSANLLKDDFTNAYTPTYRFDLLSNQGDEMAENANPHYDSGLPRRTFIGPVTFVLNGNGSAVRPTDVLDEASCTRTCEQLAEIEVEAMNQDINSEIKTYSNFGAGVNAAYEENPYFGYVGHFYKKQVNDLIPMYKGLQKIYREEMKAFSQVGYFAETMMLNYVSLGNQSQGARSAVKTLDTDCYAQWKSKNEEIYKQWRENVNVSFNVSPIDSKCFVNSKRVVSKSDFMNRMNGGTIVDDPQNFFLKPSKFYDYAADPVTDSEMKEFSKNGLRSKKLNAESKLRILHHTCHLMVQMVAPRGEVFKDLYLNRLDPDVTTRRGYGHAVTQHVQKGFAKMEKSCHAIIDDFAKKVLKGSSEAEIANNMINYSKHLPMIIERKVRVLDTTNRYIYQDGKTLNYSVNKSFSLGNGFGINRSRKYDPIELVEKSSGLFSGIGRLVSGVIGAVSSVFNFQWGESEGISKSNGTSVNSGTNLAAQISALDIELAKWEKCIVIRIEDNFLKDVYANINSRSFVREYPSYQFLRDFENIGYYVCSGDEDTQDDLNNNEPLRVRERYYYFTQIFNDGDMQDPGELVNHPWMLQLRGARDFAVFEQALMISDRQYDWGDGVGVMIRDIDRFSRDFVNAPGGSVHNTPSEFEVVNPDEISKALDMMTEGFERALPTFPGLFTFSEYPEDDVVGWPSSGSAGFKIQGPRSNGAQ